MNYCVQSVPLYLAITAPRTLSFEMWFQVPWDTADLHTHPFCLGQHSGHKDNAQTYSPFTAASVTVP